MRHGIIQNITLFVFCMLCFCAISYAQTIVITGKSVINKPVLFNNVTLDLSHGYFFITGNGKLTIQNSSILGGISPDNPRLIEVNNGTLVLKQNTMNVIADNIPPSPEQISTYNVIRIIQGHVNLANNHFTIDKSYRASLLVTGSLPTDHFVIQKNLIENFNGGFILLYSTNAQISNNKFVHVGISDIYTAYGNENLIDHNIILFSGNNNVGDGIDIINSQNTVIQKNYIASGSCYSMFVMQCQNVQIDQNIITDGITYGIYITSNVSSTDPYSKQLIALQRLTKSPSAIYPNRSIFIRDNWLIQNRYGLAAIDVTQLTVLGNFFSQHFKNSASRKFWTNNDVLLLNVNQVVWNNNLYREATTQAIDESNDLSRKLVTFPPHGGITL